MRAKQLAAALRLGHPIPPQQTADELDRLALEIITLQLWQTNLINRIKSLPRRGMQDGYSMVRFEDALKVVARKTAEIEPEQCR